MPSGRRDSDGREATGDEQAAGRVRAGVEDGPGSDPGRGGVNGGDGPVHGRRMLAGPVLPAPAEQIDRRQLRPKGYSDDSRALLEHVWALMGMPCGKHLTVILSLWLPLLQGAGDLDKPFATPPALEELEVMSAATIDRYLAPARERMRLRGSSTTAPASPLMRNSIGPSNSGVALSTTLMLGVTAGTTVVDTPPRAQRS